ncbi:MAG TPA: DUF1924 domain-containing protein [Ferrovibrio sp.]|uniref:DUF1924 domain-containing protein n=1 Tax=Ferrovibrio sp. TaxID=1917215 RepID=UPI002B4ACDAF|nr:DUF1924 domain-containing protein [Ferrovibrio sp.]HLT76948.1 DUF1924 domain-containing protein [Ferrovibrio sp.]
MTRLAAAALLALVLSPATLAAADGQQAAILDAYAAKARAADPAFTGFSAARGEALFRREWNGGDPRTPACTSCHTANPKQPGRNAKTGRPIDPAAASASPERYADPGKVEKHFSRDCKSVLGRDCTAIERGDHITFMAGQ